MDKHLQLTKVFFSLIVVVSAFTLIGSMVFYRDNINIEDRFQIAFLNIKHTFISTAYKSEFEGDTGNSTLANISSLFDRDKSTKSATVNGNAKSIPALVYHGVINEPDRANILLEDFKEQLFVLKRAGWQTITLKNFDKFIRGEAELPEKSFLLTFDDGKKDSYYPVDPLLKALDYNAIIFVITKYSLQDEAGNYYLSRKELGQMLESGRWEVEAHTKDGHNDYPIAEDGTKGHFYSNKLWVPDENRLETTEEFITRVQTDFTSAKNEIEEMFGTDVLGFAFPFGDYGQNSKNFPDAETIVPDIIKSIYPLSFYQVWEGSGFTFNYPNKNSSLMARIEVEHDWSGEKLLEILESGSEKALPYVSNFAYNDPSGWIKDWGSLDFKDSSMKIGAHASTTGSAVFLDGTYGWQDYAFKADVYPTKGRVFSLTTRYTNSKNYLACSFSDKSLRVEQVVQGQKKILSELKGEFVFVGRRREVGIGVYDNAAHCYVDGKIAIKSYTMDESLDHGGIGFKTWDPELNNSEITITEISVEEMK